MAAYVIIGNSAAGLAAAKTIRELEPEREIIVLSKEERIYSRCMLHKLMAKERSLESLEFEGAEFFQRYNIQWRPETEVVKVDEAEKVLIMEDESKLSYDKLLIASGSEYFIPPIPNFRDADNVFGFRSLYDLRRIDRHMELYGNRVVIIGGGILGLDAAYGLLKQGADVTVLEKEPQIMPLQTDDYAAKLYLEAFMKAGCKVITGIAAKNSVINSEDMITSVVLEDGREIPCNLVLVAASVKPQMDFLADSSIQALHVNYHIHTVLSRFMRKNSIHVKKGLEIDEYMRTSVPEIYAAGDVTGLSGIWPDARLMGELAAKNMCGLVSRRPEQFTDKNAVNFYGVTMISVGKVNADPAVYDVLVHHQQNRYIKLVLRDGYLEGFLMTGDITNAGVYQYLVDRHKSLEGLETRLFQLSFADWYGIDEVTGEYVYQ